MSAITPFQFHDKPIRTINDAGTAWFVLSDITDALGFSRSRDAARALDDDEKGAHIVRTLGGDQEVITVNESGIYALTFRSRRPEAKAFRKWVTSEVLPQIRKTGRYEAPTTLTPAQKRHVQERVAELAPRYERGFGGVYAAIKKAFRVATYAEIPASRYGELCEFLGCEPLEGEYLGREQALPAPRLDIHWPVSRWVEMNGHAIRPRAANDSVLDVGPYALHGIDARSPTLLLVGELERAGYDVSACRAEVLHLRHHLQCMSDDLAHIRGMLSLAIDRSKAHATRKSQLRIR